MKLRPVTTKSNFVERYRRGEFGNRSPTWTDLEEFQRANHNNYRDLFHLRNRQAGGETHYHLTLKEVTKLWEPGWYISTMAPYQLLTIQGEVSRTALGLSLRYSTLKATMREALKRGTVQVYGLRAKLLLDHHLNAASRDWMDELLDSYPDHIIEFSSFSVCWGSLPGYNTVFWEVRPDRAFGSNLSPFTEVY